MEEEEDDSLFIIPENHPLIVLSDEEPFEDHSVIVISDEESSGEMTKNRKRAPKKAPKTLIQELEEASENGRYGTITSIEPLTEEELMGKRWMSDSEEAAYKKIKIEKRGQNSKIAVKTVKIKPESTSRSKIEEGSMKVKAEAVNIKDESTKVKPKAMNIKKGSAKIETEAVNIKKERTKIKTEAKNVKKESTKGIKKEVSNIKKDFEAPVSTFEGNTPPKLGSGMQWEANMVARDMNIPIEIAKNIVSMLRNEHTVPFMARYRRQMTGNMDADNLRHVKDSYQHVKTLESKALTAIKQIKAADKLTPKVQEMIYAVKSLDELDFIYAPYKKGSCKSRAETARALGMEQAAIDLLEGRYQINVDSYVDAAKKGLQSQKEVIEAIQNIVADIFAKDEEMLNRLYEIEKRIGVTIKSNLAKTSKVKEENKEAGKKGGEDVEKKFESYYNFVGDAGRIQSHQILALNRGESLKILSVKYVVDKSLETMLYNFFERKWIKGNFRYDLRQKIFDTSFHDSYTRLISPFVIRRVKSGLNRKAQREAIESFASNLKNLLQTPPVKGCSILGIDPGFRHGSKFALISGNGDVLWTEILVFGAGRSSINDEKYMKLIREQLIGHNCELIAIGNGTGCRNIEKIFSDYIQRGFFKPLNVQYTIVNERGASIYSCSTVAKEEYPDLDLNLISAVFIARTLQDPLSEFVKVEPKHLGVGMYQHDMPEKQLSNTLDDVVEQCVSFVGVDLNTASVHLLTRVSGIGPVRAKNIIEWRHQNRLFKNRQQLLKVKGIGAKTFEQCSGFVRIHPCSVDTHEEINNFSSKSNGAAEDYNPLDRTCIHPESYALAEKFLERCGLEIRGLGTHVFIDRLGWILRDGGMERIASELRELVLNVAPIAEALVQPLDYDYRNQFSKPVFRQGLEDINTLVVGMEMMGAVANVVSFGAFVDIGVGPSGLIHSSAMNGQTVEVGDRVVVRILTVEKDRKRIGLLLLRKC